VAGTSLGFADYYNALTPKTPKPHTFEIFFNYYNYSAVGIKVINVDYKYFKRSNISNGNLIKQSIKSSFSL